MAEIQTALPYSQQIDGDRGFVMDGEYVGKVMFTPFSKAAGAITAGDTIPLVKIPGGNIRIIPELSYIAFSDTFTATADAHLGHQAYTNADGTVVAADDNEWIDNADVGGGAVSGPWTVGIGGTAVGGSTAQGHAIYDAAEGLVIEVLIDTEAGAASSTISGWVAWCHVP